MMKKIFTFLATLLLTNTCAFAQSSTALKGDLNGDGKVNVADMNYLTKLIIQATNSGDDPGTNNDDKMSKQEQTAFLDATARELISLAPASDFQNIADLMKEVRETNVVNIEDWASELYNKTLETLNTDTNTDTQTYTSGSYTYNYIYNYITRDLRSTVDISQFKGNFVLRNGVWVNTNTSASNLQFTYTDSKGALWKLTAETSGAVKKVHAFDTEDYDWVYDGYTSTDYTSTSTSTKYTDLEQHIIGVPENVSVVLTKNGTQVMKATTKIDLSNITDMEFDISRSNLNAVVTFEVNAYKVEVSQLTFLANSNVAVNVKISKGDIDLLEIMATGNVSGMPSAYASMLHDAEIDNGTVSNVIIIVDILGKVQVAGTATDLHSIIEKMDKAENNRDNESVFKANIAQANAYMNLGVYYNYEDIQQAVVYLEPFAKTSWDGYRKWEADLVISFDDQSSYSTCGNFFSESNFQNVIDDLQALVEKYDKLVR